MLHICPHVIKGGAGYCTHATASTGIRSLLWAKVEHNMLHCALSATHEATEVQTLPCSMAAAGTPSRITCGQDAEKNNPREHVSQPISRSTRKGLLSSERWRSCKIACRVCAARTGRIKCNMLLRYGSSRHQDISQQVQLEEHVSARPPDWHQAVRSYCLSLAHAGGN